MDLSPASWRPLAVGWGCGSAYLWSARDLSCCRTTPARTPACCFDEDLLFVFSTEAGWVLVCETSVRLITGQDQAARIDLADTVEGPGGPAQTCRSKTPAGCHGDNRDR